MGILANKHLTTAATIYTLIGTGSLGYRDILRAAAHVLAVEIFKRTHTGWYITTALIPKFPLLLGGPPELLLQGPSYPVSHNMTAKE